MTKKKDQFYMGGTEGTGEYLVIARTARGRIGVRPLSGGINKITKIELARVRVEPIKKDNVVAGMAEILAADKGWKQPGQSGEHRFSMVVEGGKRLKSRIAKALLVLGVGKLSTTVNPDAPAWAKKLIESSVG